MTKTTTISLVRHGEVYNPEQVYYGRLPRFPLSGQGRVQAAAAAKKLVDSKVSAVISSPLLRTRQTANIIANKLQAPLSFSSLLLEVYTPHDGQPRATLEARQWDLYTGSPLEFEQPSDIKDRLLKLFTRIRKQRSGEHVVLVSHGDCLAFTALWAGGFPLTPQSRAANLTNAAISTGYPTYASRISLEFGEDLTQAKPESLTYHPVV